MSHAGLRQLAMLILQLMVAERWIGLHLDDKTVVRSQRSVCRAHVLRQQFAVNRILNIVKCLWHAATNNAGSRT
jgi:hypothetical protein